MSWVSGLFVWLYRERLAKAWDEGYAARSKESGRAMPRSLRYAKYEIFHCHDNLNDRYLWGIVAYDGNYRTVVGDYEPATHDMALFDLIDRNINLFRPEDKPAAPREAK